MTLKSETLRKYFQSNPSMAAKLTSDFMPFDIYFLVFHGSTANGDFSEDADVDLFISVRDVDLETARSMFNKMPKFDCILVPLDRLMDFFQAHPISISMVRYGLTLIDRDSFKEKILSREINFYALENNIKDCKEMTEMVASILSLSRNDTPLWGCAHSLVFRFKQIFNIKCLILNELFTKPKLWSEANKLGISTQRFQELYKVYKFYNSMYYNPSTQIYPTKDVLLPLLEATKSSIQELKLIINDLNLPIKVK